MSKRNRRNLCTFVARTLEDGISFRLCDAIFIAYLVLIVLGTCFNINTAYEIVWLGYPATTLQLVVAIVTFLASLHICIMGDGIERQG